MILYLRPSYLVKRKLSTYILLHNWFLLLIVVDVFLFQPVSFVGHRIMAFRCIYQLKATPTEWLALDLFLLLLFDFKWDNVVRLLNQTDLHVSLQLNLPSDLKYRLLKHTLYIYIFFLSGCFARHRRCHCDTVPGTRHEANITPRTSTAVPHELLNR